MSGLLAYDPKHALNAICPYYTMFPLEYPFRILRKHRKDEPVVFDPFCGRGTTIYAARYLGLQSWGLDTSPIAVAIARAKLAVSGIDEILDLATSLAKRTPKRVPETEFFRKAYRQKTLKQICAVRDDDTLWCWGAADNGVLGRGLTQWSATPRGVLGL